MAEKDIEKKVKLPKSDYNLNIFGNSFLYNLAKQTFLMTALFLFAFTLGSENSHLVLIPITFILIARHRYIVTKREKIVEKHGSTIAAIQSKVSTLTGESITESQVVKLWLDRIIRTDGWLIHIRPSQNDEVELIGIKRQTP